ncbi:hypothetical protein BST63_00050 [Bradyrhizobium canariense]|uniref:Uncharacterized protein n=1 Tax=Bradyrhizobium canariense TaxID=255045 RepID=A0ABX3XBU5_9BRAD|nr:DUF1688 family protein [Bradyrhizobium canariense]OSJ37130.1 hypothetical protein BST63_00050 [Bradyrhizobium canariense]
MCISDSGQRAHAVDSLLVVEWRALTVALLDRLAELVRAKLGRTPETLPPHSSTHLRIHEPPQLHVCRPTLQIKKS